MALPNLERDSAGMWVYIGVISDCLPKIRGAILHLKLYRMFQKQQMRKADVCPYLTKRVSKPSLAL